MTEIDPDDPRLQGRPLWGLAILSLPIFGVIAVSLAYVVMWSLGLSGRSASGAQAEIVFEGCADARAPIEARIADMGLSPTSWREVPGGFAVQTQLTGDPEVDARLPETLTLPGALQIRAGDQILATHEDLTDASVRLDLFMVSYVLLRLRDEAAQRIKRHVRAEPMGKLWLWVDGQRVAWQANQNPVAVGELELSPEISDEQERMYAVAAWAVVLDHGPLPCPVVARINPETPGG